VGDVTVRDATTLDDLASIHDIFVGIWGPAGAPEVHLVRAVQWSGGYASLAEDDGRVIGGSFGFVGIRPDLHLHSHITGVIPDAQDRAVGLALKQHQRDWCAGRDIRVIRWTFDPLVRRNAWFNLRRLGAEIESFHADFYGDMHDEVNAGDRSDRFVVRWATDAAAPVTSFSAPPGSELFALPEDVAALRRADPERADRLRLELRAALDGRRVAGITDAGEYALVDE
jgi:predicted GNAT superfamily acetyltransferase